MSTVAISPNQTRRKVLVIRPFIGGLKLDQNSILTDPHFCVADSNWLFYNGEVTKRPGLTKINDAVLVSASTYITGSFRFRLRDGTVRQVVCTPTRIFSLNNGVQTDRTATAFTGVN